LPEFAKLAGEIAIGGLVRQIAHKNVCQLDTPKLQSAAADGVTGELGSAEHTVGKK
jgi:hypothetical protein